MNRPILACITPQAHCISIIEAAKLIAQELDTRLCVVTVLPVKESATLRAQKLKTLKSISKMCDVDITIRFSDNAYISIATQAYECNPMHVFMGEDNGFLNKFLSVYNQSPVSVVSQSMVFTVPSTDEIKGA